MHDAFNVKKTNKHWFDIALKLSWFLQLLRFVFGLRHYHQMLL
jgi:hypothetical protein